jgi:NAD-dependent dihydropyrimidine dehydrogenase PreA subunit
MSKKVFMIPNPSTPSYVIKINPDICDGCNTCIEACRTGVLVPNPEQGKPPIVLYPDECWFGGCCQAHCPKPGAIKFEHPLFRRVGWKRKKTGEYFRLGMHNPPPPNTKPPV